MDILTLKEISGRGGRGKMTSAAQEELICGLHEFQKITGIKVSLNEETASMSLTSFKSIMPLLLYVSTKGESSIRNNR